MSSSFKDPRLTLPNFAQGVIEHLFLRCRTGDLKAGQVGEEFQVWAGNRLYTGPTADEAWSAFFKDLPSYDEITPEGRQAMMDAGREVEQEENAQFQETLEALTEDGLSELGTLAEGAKADRQSKIIEALLKIREEKTEFSNVLDFVRAVADKAGLEEVGSGELTAALQQIGPEA